jgi:hypothetical protein
VSSSLFGHDRRLFLVAPRHADETLKPHREDFCLLNGGDITIKLFNRL